jgi:CheY-like chemotaxis protein
MALLNLELMKKALSFAYQKKAHEERNLSLEEAGIQVTAVTNAAEAMAMLRESNFDVVIVGPHVPRDERERVAAFARLRRARTIFLYKNTINGAESGDAVISADGSPADLIDAVLSLTA